MKDCLRQLLIGLVTASFALAASAADEPPREYTLKQETASTGTRLKRDIGFSAEVPLNKKYHQLTADEKRVVHAAYEGIADGDEPPFPLGGQGAVLRGVLKIQQELMLKGELFLIAEVDAKGRVDQVSVVAAPDPQMAKGAAVVLMSTPFKPAVCAGKPCKMEYPLHLELSIRH